MKCSIGFLLIAFGVFQTISAWPVGSGGMMLYQPDYYRHRAFVMHYASQPVKSYRRQGQAATSLYAAGKKISTDSYVRNVDDEDAENDYQESQEQPSRSPAHSTSIAVAGQQSHSSEPENDAPDSFDTQENNNIHPARDEEPVEDEEEQTPTRSKVKSKGGAGNGGVTYFPINFGGNPGVVAIANSYSTGKGGSASSRATAYGSPSSKLKKKLH